MKYTQPTDQLLHTFYSDSTLSSEIRYKNFAIFQTFNPLLHTVVQEQHLAKFFILK